MTPELAKKIVLKDDNTETGGISFRGETLYDFLEEIKPIINKNPYSLYLEEINSYLSGSGIQEIKITETQRSVYINDLRFKKQKSVWSTIDCYKCIGEKYKLCADLPKCWLNEKYRIYVE